MENKRNFCIAEIVAILTHFVESIFPLFPFIPVWEIDKALKSRVDTQWITTKGLFELLGDFLKINFLKNTFYIR